MSDQPLKFDSNKSRMDLIRPDVLIELGNALAYGATKYNEKAGDVPNFMKGDGFNYSRIYASLQRHLNLFYSGEDTDPESGLPHISLALANLHILCTYYFTDFGIDDRINVNKGSKRLQQEGTNEEKEAAT
jgi:hypothetical protein